MRPRVLRDEKTREQFVDNVKLLACILVVLGHLYQSMVRSHLLPEDEIYRISTSFLYLFHVQLFFVCSGYLYQKYSKVDSIRTWESNLLKKIIALGVPYYVFSTFSWLMREMFSGSVNLPNEVSLPRMLLLEPTSPYWYLIVLTIMFLLPTINSARAEVVYVGLLFVSTFAMKCIGSCLVSTLKLALRYVFFFLFGMVFSCIIQYMYVLLDKKWKRVSLFVLLMVWMSLGIIFFIVPNFPIHTNRVWQLILCTLILLYFKSLEMSGVGLGFLEGLKAYTFPIFLMHTIFAAPVRLILLKIGVTNALIHIVGGFFISIAGPIIIYRCMRKIRWPLIIIYPLKWRQDAVKDRE